MERVDMTKKEKIIIFYYEQKLNTIAISNKLNVSKQYVSKILKTDIRYKEEKNRRKEINKIEQQNRKVKYNKKRRNKNRENNEQIDANLNLLHIQDSIELSSRRTINNRAFRNWNPSIYKFHDRTKEYRLKEEMKDKVSYAVPKKINWKGL